MEEEINIEKVYQKKTQIEHILLRPDTYIGSTEMTTTQLWVMDKEEQGFENREVSYVPGLYKIFDEILVNAADNYQRDRTMNKIMVEIDAETNRISVWNNGRGIPIKVHNEYNVYVAELIFGHLLTSSHYNDQEKKVTGGRNGYGAKLTNIFSERFTVETADSNEKKKLKITWTKNMSEKDGPHIEDYSGKDYTCITYIPDLSKFKQRRMKTDFIDLMKKRVYDLAGVISEKVKLFLNNKLVDVQGFPSYVDLYLEKATETYKEVPPVIIEKKRHDNWSVIVSLSEGQFQQVSFVNSICTARGGQHVNYITDQITQAIIKTIKKRYKKLNVKPFQIKNHLWIFINSLIVNPAFDSQTKETLTTKPQNFGSECKLSQRFINNILASGILDSIVLQAKAKEEAQMQKKLAGHKKSRLIGIPKLEDANWAGTRNADKCTLILTEGDSAKALAMSGIQVVGRDVFGVFPLKGKLLNVRDASTRQLSSNAEIQNVTKIMGLQVGKKYTSCKGLRYGSLMIMADQDHDGSHIKGLIINFIHHFWPDLVKSNKFLKEFITPIIKVTKIKGKESISFFTIQDYENWNKTQGTLASKWKVKYYKGLGTSTDREGKSYFKDLKKHVINFEYINEKDDEAINLAFSKKHIQTRKKWVQFYDPQYFVDHKIKQLRYRDFIYRELIQFSVTDNQRSIPSICDGLKQGQRKILFACFKRNLKQEIKVAQLAGYVAEHSAYHHGEASLCGTIVNMAQDFVGTNNVNYLEPIGQFGTRNLGGKDAASARYIFTTLSSITRKLFIEEDDHLLNYLTDDGELVEPEWYMPILPTVLINGAEGIGTGWSTFIPCFNPKELASTFKRRLRGEQFEEMEIDPWYRGFTGQIIWNNRDRDGYKVYGRLTRIDHNTIEISELPLRKWTRDYKNFLEQLQDKKTGNYIIDDIKEHHTSGTVSFELKVEEDLLDQKTDEELRTFFKLGNRLSMSNMVLFNSQGRLQKYTEISDILEEFYEVRYKYYENRKEYLVSKIKKDFEILSNKLRFIQGVIKGDVDIRNKKKKQIIKQLVDQGFQQMKLITKIKSTKLGYDPNEAEEIEIEEYCDLGQGDKYEKLIKEYNYLLNMSMWSLTTEKVNELTGQIETKKKQLQLLEQTTVKDVWEKDLDGFLLELEKIEKKYLDSKGKSRKGNDQVEEEKAGDETSATKKGLFNVSNNKVKNKRRRQTKTMRKAKEKKLKKKQGSMDVLKDFQQTLGISSYLNPETKKKKPLKSAQQKIRPTLSVRDSILKYLNRPAIQNVGFVNKQPGKPGKGELSLVERIQMREQKNDLKAFDNAFDDEKCKYKPTKPLQTNQTISNRQRRSAPTNFSRPPPSFLVKRKSNNPLLSSKPYSQKKRPQLGRNVFSKPIVIGDNSNGNAQNGKRNVQGKGKKNNQRIVIN